MYFKNIPLVSYQFGDGEDPIIFDNISTYVDLLDQLKDNVSFYQKYYILDGDRPDVVSQKLYGRPDYHWTFFLMNDKIRESGWPLTEQKIRELTMQRFPNRVVTTESSIGSFFLPGSTVTGKLSGTVGTVIERNLDLGQIVINTQDNFGIGEQLVEGTTAEQQAERSVVIKADTIQYNAVHHYEDADGNWVDIDPSNQVTTGLIPVTYMDKNVDFNNSLKDIVIIKPSAIEAVAREFYSKMRS